MNKQLLLLFALLFLGSAHVWAQNVVSGKVTDETGAGLPGVNVLVTGTSQGTVTDGDGNYSISVPEGGSLSYSFIGYLSQRLDVGDRSELNVALDPDVQQLGEVVVTALGVERETKALGYSVTSVDGEEFQEARTNNLTSNLVGRVAGVNATSVAGGPTGSTRVIIRGNKTLLGNNQPLYVIDGIPMDNTNYGQAGLWGGADEGDGMSSINPDDIESITVLKGANAAALYGSRAANGVINIVTKKGTARKGIGVEWTTNYVVENVNDLRDYQKEFGQGNYVRSDPADPDSPFIAVAPRTQQEGTNWNTTSWGPRLGSGNFVAFDGVSRPYVDAGDNFPRYYRTGYNVTNTLALTGGSETQNFRVSFGDLRNEGVVPASGFDRQNVSLSTNSRFGEKLTLTAKVLYSHEEARGRTNLSDSPSNAHLSMYYVPTNMNVDWYYGDPNKPGAIPQDIDDTSLLVWGKSPGEELPVGQHNWHQNMWWVAYQGTNDDVRDRIITSGQLRYDITDFLWVQGRIGMDWLTRRESNKVAQGTSYQRGGSISENERRIREINMEWMLGFDDTFGPISVNAFVGGNRMRHENENLNLSGNAFNVPFFEVINNSVTRTWGYGFSEFGINSLFGSAEIGYNNILFLTATARQDWFSVLNPEDNSVLYPSIGASFVLSDALTLPGIFSFAKVRASWAQVGNATIAPYATNLTYSLSGNPHVGYPWGSFTSAFGQGGNIPNPDLGPMTSTEFEVGFDVRLLQNRLGIDFAYYSQKTEDDILNATISRGTGFGSTSVNVGELRNRGVELLLTGTPIQGPLTWDISLNLAHNDNEVVSLIEGSDELVLEEPRSRNVFIKHIVGHPFGMITGRVQKEVNGQGVFLEDGSPVQEDGFAILGNGVPDLTGGLNNSLTYKNFNLSFLIDFKAGGDIFSGTNNRLTQTGLTKLTLQGREGEEPLTLSGVIQTGEETDGTPIYGPFERTLTPNEAQGYWGDVGSETNAKTDMFIYDASFVKLRQVTIGYNFPSQLVSRTPFTNVRLAVVGRNLAILHKNTPNIDPESSYTNSNSQGLEYFGYPSVRSYGFDLKLQF